ncbi:hypothetical protein GWI33_010467 [Rhynchophorus ferrugineus]|uniref:Uncharacterized protein n=1 Tax=Rhynchophorus ferrugineus TaxID=354439 RepID=A0A834MDZ1_RHYFE|nr:hypothetical protein GWI33_010467 [Rhynchophorus ferrugineus]
MPNPHWSLSDRYARQRISSLECPGKSVDMAAPIASPDSRLTNEGDSTCATPRYLFCCCWLLFSSGPVLFYISKVFIKFVIQELVEMIQVADTVVRVACDDRYPPTRMKIN